MIAQVRTLEEDPLEPEPDKWSQFVPHPVRDGVRQSSRKTGEVVPIFGEKSEVPWYDPEDPYSELRSALWQAWEGLDEDEVATAPAVSAGANVKDESEALNRWLRNANPIGYTTLIRTRPKSKRTDQDVVVVHGEKCEAPQRLKRMRRKVDGKAKFFDVPDIVEVDEIECESILTYRNGKARTVVRTREEFSGLSPLGRPYQCSFVPLRFTGDLWTTDGQQQHADYIEDKLAYLRRKQESNAVRKKLGKHIEPPSKILVRRPPDVMWFLNHPSGMSEIYGDDEPWPHDWVDPQAERVNQAMRQKLADVTNSMRADGIVPMCTVQEYGDAPDGTKSRRYSSARALHDPFFNESAAGKTVPQYRGNDTSSVMKEALAAYARHLKESESGYRPEDVHDTADIVGYEMVSGEVVDMRLEGDVPDDTKAAREEAADDGHTLDPEDVLFFVLEAARRLTIVGNMRQGPKHIPYAELVARRPGVRRYSVHDVVVDEETGKGNQSESTEDPVVPAGEREDDVLPRMGMDKPQLRRILAQSVNRQLELEPTQLVPAKGSGQGAYPGHVDVYLEGGYHRIRYDDPKHIDFLEYLIDRHDDERDVLVELMVRLRAIHGWPTKADEYEDLDVNMDGLLDDADAEVNVERISGQRKMLLSDLMRSTNWHVRHKCYLVKHGYWKFLRAMEAGDAKIERQAQARRIQAIHLKTREWRGQRISAAERRKIMNGKLHEQRRRRRMKAKAERVRHRAMQARSHRYTMLSRAADQRDGEIMANMTTANKTTTRLSRKWQAMLFRAERWWRGESAPTQETELIPPTFAEQVASQQQGESQKTNTAVRPKGRPASSTAEKQAPQEAANDPIIEPKIYTPVSAESIPLVGYRQWLMQLGVDEADLRVTDQAIQVWFPRLAQRAQRHRDQRAALVA